MYNRFISYFYSTPVNNEYLVLDYNKDYNEIVEYYTDEFNTDIVLYNSNKSFINKINEGISDIYRIVYENLTIWYYRMMEENIYERHFLLTPELPFYDTNPIPPTTSWIVSYDENNIPHLSPDKIFNDQLLLSDNDSINNELTNNDITNISELTLSNCLNDENTENEISDENSEYDELELNYEYEYDDDNQNSFELSFN